MSFGIFEIEGFLVFVKIHWILSHKLLSCHSNSKVVILKIHMKNFRINLMVVFQFLYETKCPPMIWFCLKSDNFRWLCNKQTARQRLISTGWCPLKRNKIVCGEMCPNAMWTWTNFGKVFSSLSLFLSLSTEHKILSNFRPNWFMSWLVWIVSSFFI